MNNKISLLEKIQTNYLLALEISDTELLNYMREHGRITMGEAQSDIIMNKRTYYLNMHNYTITQGKDGGWFTHFTLPTGKRITARASDRTSLEDKIITHYKEQEEAPTFRDVFYKWIEEKLHFGEIAPSSYTRYMNDFKRFFSDDMPFCSVRLINMTDSIMERFIKQSIKDHSLTRKTFSGLRILLIGVLKYAKREGYTNYSISTFFGDLSLPDRIFEKRKVKKDEEEVFNIAETKQLIEHLKCKGDIRSLGLVLMFQTGMRVGELVALKFNNITSIGIEIIATEVYYTDQETGKKVFAVQDTPKTEAGERIIYLPPQAYDTLNMIRRINPFGEYLFMDDGKRILSKSMNYHLKKACREIGIPERSTHKIRKTYASTLLRNNVDERLIMKQLGHRNIGTTKTYYYFDTNDMATDQNIISNAVNL